MNSIVARAIAYAVKEAESKVREVGTSNTGRRVEEYQATTTLGGTGWPWCAAYVNWCILQAWKEYDAMVGEAYPWIPTASCDFILDFARRQNIFDRHPQPGDVFLVLSSTNPNDAIHTGFVTHVDGDSIRTAEGNTNTSGSRNGNGVYKGKRALSKRLVYVRWGNLCPTPQERASWMVKVGTREIGAMLDGGRAWVPAYQWADALGVALGWRPEAQAVTLDGREVPKQPKIVEGRAWLSVRDLAAFSGLKLNVEPGLITVHR